MAEDRDDKNVDALIAELESTLTKLKAAQSKDVADESGEEDRETPREQQPTDLKTASVRVREHFRQIRRNSSK